MGTRVENTTFSEPSSSGPGPWASFGHAFPCWALALSFLCLAFTLLPTQLSSLQQNVHSWQPHLFNLLPRKQDGWAGLLSQHRGGKQDSGPQLRVFLPVFLGKLVWETVLNCLSFPRLEITSAQLAALNSQAEARALSSCSRAWWR